VNQHKLIRAQLTELRTARQQKEAAEYDAYWMGEEASTARSKAAAASRAADQARYRADEEERRRRDQQYAVEDATKKLARAREWGDAYGIQRAEKMLKDATRW
jgi:hypothetical protein